MRIHLQKDFPLAIFFCTLGAILLTLIGCLFVLQHISMQQQHVEEQRYQSYLLADELRQSSDDLSKMVRIYVVTGDPQYRAYYQQILDIRNGVVPRPQNYNQIYWDFILGGAPPSRTSGPTISLRELMVQEGFTIHEFDLLQDAQDKSDDLTELEIKAMNAMVGKFDNGSGAYTLSGPPNQELAQQLIFSPEYLKAKAAIMQPIQTFLEHVAMRTENSSKHLAREVRWTLSLAIALSVAATLFMVLSLLRTLHTLSRSAQESEMLLLNILPRPIAERLKQGEELIADEYHQASVLFADIVGFTAMTFKIGTTQMVRMLNALFAEFDRLSEQYGVEKVKTIGDNYMAVGGIPTPVSDHAIRLAHFALALQEKLKEFNQKEHSAFELRIGMSCGNVIAGIIGHKKFIYDVWGDAVNMASRMQSTGKPGEIQITDKMAVMLEEQFEIEAGPEVEIKGKGPMKPYILKGKRAIF